MSLIIENPILTEQLANCTNTLQNASSTQAQLLDQIHSLNGTINIMLWIIVAVFIGAVIYALYQVASHFWSYKIGIVKHGHISWFKKWHLESKVLIKHSKNDSFEYAVNPECIYGTTLLWYYKNAQPIQLSEGNNLPSTKDISYSALNRSTIIEKFVSAEDFIKLIKILIIISIVIGVINLLLGYMVSKQDLVCNLIIENKTMLTNIIQR